MSDQHSDRELLELAAKAACIEGGWSDYHRGICYSHHLDMRIWNPLTDDGDALRLAETLSISIHWCITGRVYAHAKGGIVEVYESSREDRAANVRRAIVRAAAKIWQSMP